MVEMSGLWQAQTPILIGLNELEVTLCSLYQSAGRISIMGDLNALQNAIAECVCRMTLE